MKVKRASNWLISRNIGYLLPDYWRPFPGRTNDLVSLAQILGHENLNTTARYTKRTQQQLNEASEKLNY